MKISRRKPLCELGEESVTVTFGPGSDPEKYQLNLIEEAFKRKIISLEDYNRLEFEYGHRLEEIPYSEVGYARKGMPPHYLYEGSVWLNFYQPNGSCAHISLVPHFHDTIIENKMEPPHHNYILRWMNFNGSKGSERYIKGHKVPINEPVVLSITCGIDHYEGTINIENVSSHSKKKNE